MTILGFDVATFAVVAGLMVVCGGAMGRLLWLLDGRPPLDRPSWWPGAGDAGRAPADAAPPAPRRTRLATVAACALCCGTPALIVAGIASLAVAVGFSRYGGALVLAVVVGWAVLSGRVKRRRRPATSASTASGRSSCCADDAEG